MRTMHTNIRFITFIFLFYNVIKSFLPSHSSLQSLYTPLFLFQNSCFHFSLIVVYNSSKQISTTCSVCVMFLVIVICILQWFKMHSWVWFYYRLIVCQVVFIASWRYNFINFCFSPMSLRIMNDQLMYLERAFIDPLGLPGRPFYRWGKKIFSSIVSLCVKKNHGLFIFNVQNIFSELILLYTALGSVKYVCFKYEHFVLRSCFIHCSENPVPLSSLTGFLRSSSVLSVLYWSLRNSRPHN